MLTSTIYVNNDGILNDYKHDYENIGWPFLYETGQSIYRHELKLKRKYIPDLSPFEMEYQKRKDYGRSAIKKADN